LYASIVTESCIAKIKKRKLMEVKNAPQMAIVYKRQNL